MPALSSVGGFLTPLFLAGIPLAVGMLMYVYRRRGKGTDVLFPTFFLIGRFHSAPSRPRRFVPPLRFFFESLLALLLLAGAAGMYLQDSGERVVLLVDNSFSMSARGEGPGGFGSLMEAAVTTAKQRLETLPMRSQVLIAVTSPSLRGLSGGYGSRSAAHGVLDSITYTYARDDLSSAVQRVIEQYSPDRIIVVSEKGLASPSVSSSREGVAVEVARVGLSEAQRMNVMMRSLRIERMPEGIQATGSAVLYRAPRDLTAETFAATVRIFGIREGGRERHPLLERTISLSPGMETEFQFAKLPASYEGFAAHVGLSSQLGSTAADTITDDNWAWGSAQLDVAPAMVVSDYTAEQLGLNRIALVPWVTKSLTEYAQIAREGKIAAMARLLVFHRVTPAEHPGINALYILPPSGSMFTLEPRVRDASVSSWMDAHPLTRYLNMPLLQFSHLEPLKVPVWAKALLVTDKGVAAFVGDRDGARVVTLGFELFPYEGKRQPGLSVLTVNILKWLLGDGSDALGYVPHAPLTISGGGKARYLDAIGTSPAGEFLAEGISSRLVPQVPGLVQLDVDRVTRAHAVNFLDGSESDISREQLFDAPRLAVGRASAKAPWFMAESLARIALLLLLADLVFLALIQPLWRRRHAGV